MSLPACLVTSTPSYEEPERTAPFLLSVGADPDLRRLTVIDLSSLGSDPAQRFAAIVRSEDNGEQVIGRLVLDYGTPVPGGSTSAYRYLNETSIAGGTLADTSRELGVTWAIGDTVDGCHNVTLLATHEINFVTGCPADPADFDFLTWPVLLCSSAMGTCCDPTAPPNQGGCTTFQCPKVDPKLGCDIAPAPQDFADSANPGDETGGAP